MKVSEILEHHGVKGMKWGVRKSKIPKQGPSGDAKDAHGAFVKAKVSGVQALSNKELQNLNNRLQMEKKYSELAHVPNVLERGLKTVTGLLKTGNTVNDAIAFANSPTGKKIAATMSKKTATTAAKTAT